MALAPRPIVFYPSTWPFLFLYALTAHCSLASTSLSPPTHSFAKKRLPIILVVVFGFLFLLMALCCLLPRGKKQWKKRAVLCNEEKAKDQQCAAAASLHCPVKRLNWTEVDSVTGNFATVIGEGGFSTVYLARLSGSELGAVKVIRSSERLTRAFRQELDLLLRLRHPNIVKLLGYCDEREEGGVLLLEFVPNGTLHEKLHGDGTEPVVTWRQRMSIASGVARAIEHLHDRCDAPIVHCDIKSSNVLLDEQCLAPKLCDFGSARVGFESTVARSSHSPVVFGSLGYVDPYYLRTGIASKKSDVYSFGVLLLELLTGAEAFCAEKERLLTRGVAAEVIRDPARAPEIADPRLAGDFDAEEARRIASIASSCLREQPALRPSMADVVSLLSGNATENHLTGGASALDR